MPATTLRCLALGAVLAAAGTAGASGPASECKPPARADPLADRAGTLAQYERLPRACLVSLFQHCSRAAGEALLDPGSAAVCSFGYEALLRQGFGGDFGAMMAWWRSQRTASAP